MSENAGFISGAAAFFERANRAVLAVERILGGVLMGFVLIVVCVNILSRYVMVRPISWGEELASFSFVWTALLSSAYALGREAHVRISVITSRFSPRFQTWLHVFNCLVAIAAFGVFLPYSITVMKFLTPSPAMRIPEQYFYIIVPIVFVLFIFHLTASLFRNLAVLKKGA